MSSIPNTLTSADFSLAAAQANQLASSQIMVAQMNTNLKTIYLTAFNNWKISVDAGRIPNTDPPQPPKGYVVSSPDANGFQWPVPGNDPVCDVPPIPEDHSLTQQQIQAALTPNTIDIGKNIGGKWFSVGPKDTFGVGQTTPPIPDVDGSFHTYEKYGAAVGAGWYLELS